MPDRAWKTTGVSPLKESEATSGIPARKPASARVIAITSGKGGVGKTSLAVNLAISLTSFGHRVLVMDADIGLGNVDLMLGLTPKFNLTHLVERKKTLDEVIITGPAGVRLLPCGSGGKKGDILSSEKRKEIVDVLKANAEYADTVLIDTGGGLSDNMMDFLFMADEVYLVTTPEPTAIMDSYGIIRTLAQEMARPRVKLVINMAGDQGDASHVMSTMRLITRQFFNLEFDCLGCVGYDQNMTKSIRMQQPIVQLYPSSRASRDIGKLAMKIADCQVDYLAERGIAAWARRVLSYFR